MKKWIITVKLPSGGKMAFSRHENNFALVPVEENVVRKASCWDSKEDAEKYLEAQLECAPNLEKLAPFEFEQCELPQ